MHCLNQLAQNPLSTQSVKLHSGLRTAADPDHDTPEVTGVSTKKKRRNDDDNQSTEPQQTMLCQLPKLAVKFGERVLVCPSCRLEQIDCSENVPATDYK